MKFPSSTKKANHHCVHCIHAVCYHPASHLPAAILTSKGHSIAVLFTSSLLYLLMASKHKSRDAYNFVTIYCYNCCLILDSNLSLHLLIIINYYMYVYTGKGWLGVTQDFKTGGLKGIPSGCDRLLHQCWSATNFPPSAHVHDNFQTEQQGWWELVLPQSTALDQSVLLQSQLQLQIYSRAKMNPKCKTLHSTKEGPQKVWV